MIYPLVRELAAEIIPVAVTCRVLGFTKQAFDKWAANPVSQRDWDDAHLINAAYDIHADDPAFGYRFIAGELHERGLKVGENRVARLCSQQRIWSVFSKKRGVNRKAGPPVHDDLVDRKFTATAPNVTWLTDITEHNTGEGELYLCDQGRLLRANRRLLDRLADEGVAGCGRAAQRHRPTRPRWHGRAFRPR
jgi:transposase InsO family protein